MADWDETTRPYNRYTPEKLDLMARLKAEGKKPKEIADVIGHPVRSVATMLERMAKK